MASRLIYGLYDPRDPLQTVQYVGCTQKTLQKRIIAHNNEALSTDKSSLRAEWLRCLLRENVYAAGVILETVLDRDDWQIRERFWIAHFPNLLNQTAGGIGMHGYKASEATKRRAAVIASNISDETRQKMIETARARCTPRTALGQFRKGR